MSLHCSSETIISGLHLTRPIHLITSMGHDADAGEEEELYINLVITGLMIEDNGKITTLMKCIVNGAGK